MANEVVGGAVYTAEVDTSKLSGDLARADAQIRQTGAATERAFSSQGSAAATKYGGVVGFVHNQFAALKGQLGAPEIGHGVMQGIGFGGGLAAFSLVEEGIKGVADAIKGFIDDATASQAVEAKLTTSLRDNVPAWQDQTAAIDEASAAGIKLGFTNNQTADSLAQLVTHTHDVTEAVKLQAAAEDLARLKGMDLDTATKILGKVYDGNTSILTRYGIAIGKHATAEQALTAIEKAAGGQAEAYSKTLKGQQAVLDAEAESVREKIGGVAIPIMQQFMTFLAGPVMDTVNGVINLLGDLGNAFNDLHRFISPATAAEQDYEKAVTAAGQAAGLTDETIQHLIKTHQDEAAAQQALNSLHLTGIGVVDDMTTSLAKLLGVNDQWIQTINKGKAAVDAQGQANSVTGNTFADMAVPITNLLGLTGTLTAGVQQYTLVQQRAAAVQANAAQIDVNVAAIKQRIADTQAAVAAQTEEQSNGLIRQANDSMAALAVSVRTQIADTISQWNGWKAAGSKALQDLGDGMQQGAQNLLPKLKDLRDFLKNGLTPNDLAMQAEGKKYINEVATGMQSAVIGAKPKFEGVAIQAIADISNVAASPTGAKATGSYITQLVASGMTAPESIARVTGAGGTVNDQFLQSLSDTTGYKKGGAAVVGAWSDGANSAMTHAMETINNVLAKIRAAMVGQSPPKEGPLHEMTGASGAAVFHDWVEGAVAKVADGADRIQAHVGRMATGAMAPQMPGAGSGYLGAGSTSSRVVNVGGISVVVNGATGDPQQLGDTIADKVYAALEHVLLEQQTLSLDLSGIPGR